MRRLIVAFVLPLLAGCSWSPFSGGSPVATHGPSFHRCAVNTPHGPMPCSPSPPPVGPRGRTVLAGAGALADNASDSYLAWGSSIVSATEGPVEIPLPPGSSTISDLRVNVTAAAGGGASWTLTVDKNGTSTALTCSIAGAAQTCSDSSLVAVVAGDKIDLGVTPFGSPAIASITWSVVLRLELSHGTH